MGSGEVNDRSGGMRRWIDRECALLAARWCNTTQPSGRYTRWNSQQRAPGGDAVIVGQRDATDTGGEE